jgi:hypothetical protein
VAHLQKIFSDAGKTGQIPKQDYESAAWAPMDVTRGFIEGKILSKTRLAEEDARSLSGFNLNAVRARNYSGRPDCFRF